MKKLVLSIILLAVTAIPASAAGPTRVTAGNIKADAVWSGEVIVEKPVTVTKGATLTVKPGAVVKFKKGAGLTVEGVLKAVGSAKSPAVFTSAEKTPAPGDWSGVMLNGSGDGTVISGCRFEYAESVSMSGCSPVVKDNEITSGIIGILPARKGTPSIKNNRISGMEVSGISCQLGSAPTLTGNAIENCKESGIVTAQDSRPIIMGNTIKDCPNGIMLTQSVPSVENNTISSAGACLTVTSGEAGMLIRGNKFLDSQVGLVCQQFSSPIVEKNLIKGNKQGLVCYRSSSPTVKNNEFTGNEEALLAIQICTPYISGNSIHGNGKAIYLDLSSYAVINGNNIYDNKVQFELGNMSSDWEHRVLKKPVRGSQAQNFSRADRGKAVRQAVKDDATIMGSVDAKGNWWGEDVTKEMNAKGPDANIESFTDYFDTPTRTYEGYDGEYLQDRIVYEGWKSAKIKGAGI